MTLRTGSVALTILGALLGTSAAWGMSSAAATPPRNAALPDLAPADAPLREHFLSEEEGRLLLRFPAVIANLGAGPMEVVGRRAKPRGRMRAYQVFYKRNGKRLRRLRIGAFHYHGEHSHWHLLAVARYRLLHLDGQPVSEGTKVSFCFRDSLLAGPEIPGRPAFARYGDCSRDRRATRLRAGISVGWADLYASHLPDQWVDVTGLPPGEYFLECEVDPDHLLVERTRGNNTARVRVRLR